MFNMDNVVGNILNVKEVKEPAEANNSTDVKK